MTFTASDVIALAAVVATVGVAWFGHLDRAGDRTHARDLAREAHDHERTLAREARLQDRRAATYVDMLEMAFRVEDAVRQRNPFFVRNPPPPPVEMPSLDEQRPLAARISAYGSPRVFDLWMKVASCMQAFDRAAWGWEIYKVNPGMPLAGTPEEVRSAQNEMEARRKDAYRAVEELVAAAQEELSS